MYIHTYWPTYMYLLSISSLLSLILSSIVVNHDDAHYCLWKVHVWFDLQKYMINDIPRSEFSYASITTDSHRVVTAPLSI